MMPRPPFLNRFGAKKKKYAYVPPPTSGAYAILVGMLKAEQNELIKNLSKQQVLDYCTKYSQAGLKDNSKIWASMKGLIDKSLIGRHIARDPLYFLEDEGRDLALKLIALAEGTDIPAESNDEDESRGSELVTDSQQSVVNTISIGDDESTNNFCDSNFRLDKGTYEIVMIIDQREKIVIEAPFKTETRTLACGDFLWVARPKDVAPNDKTKDLVLDFVVERKRLDDLSSSIFDGRFEQQKQRLLDSGVRRPLYLIEDMSNMRPGSVTSAGLAQAIINTLIHDGISYERVRNVGHVNDYLIGMTKCLEQLYSKFDCLKSCSQERLRSDDADINEFMTFCDFQTKGAKITNWTVREMFAKHLIQITGMSDKRVAVIIKKYPTISALLDAYKSCNSEKEKENLLSKLEIPDSNRTIGPAISKRVYCCYAMPHDQFCA